MKNINLLFNMALIISLSLVFSNCKKEAEKQEEEIPVVEEENNNNTITEPFYISVDIDGVNMLHQYGKDGYGCAAGSSGGTVPSGHDEEQSMVISILGVQEGYFGVGIVKNFTSAPTACSQIQAMFALGTYPFGKISTSTTEDGIDGVVIQYVDASSVIWTTDKGTALQTGSSFSITEHIDNDGSIYPYSEKITKATFNCILYDGNGNTLTLTNGEIRCPSVQCGSI